MSEPIAEPEVLLYEHREDALTCYDHGGYCCVCGEHDVIGYRTHLADLIAARDRRVRIETAEGIARAIEDITPPAPHAITPRTAGAQGRRSALMDAARIARIEALR